jgi:hypothetical protein
MTKAPKTAIVFMLIIGLLSLGALLVLAAWNYTTLQLASARTQGVFPSAEEGMRGLIDAHYVGVTSVDILTAGPNSFNGSQPHIWYVIAEVRAARRADGSELGHNGCDGPGSFFLQAKDGWVHVPEGAFPELVGLWMKVFGLAGSGSSEPTARWPADHSARLCLSA